MANSDREKQLFLAALELPTPAEREAFLRGACAHDSDLYQRLHVLIAMHDQSRGPLDQPPTGLEPAATRLPLSPETVGAEIGPYKLLQQIGEGGMGIGLPGRPARAGASPSRAQGDQAGDGLGPGDCPL